jgi:hypothetical protein
MSKYTPGPWKTDDFDDDAPFAILAGRQAVCMLGEHGELKPFRAFENAKANARLIAAAPELLEALELCLQKLAAMAEHFGDRWPFDLNRVRAETAARAAIAKATGGAE